MTVSGIRHENKPASSGIVSVVTFKLVCLLDIAESKSRQAKIFNGGSSSSGMAERVC
jgi:hypothetical protein